MRVFTLPLARGGLGGVVLLYIRQMNRLTYIESRLIMETVIEETLDFWVKNGFGCAAPSATDRPFRTPHERVGIDGAGDFIP